VKIYILYQSNEGVVILIKVVILTPYYYPIHGGIPTFVNNLRINLANKGCSVLIISNTGNENSHVKVINRGKYFFILNSYRILRKEKPDVLHSHSRWNILTPSVIYKLFHPKTTIIHTYHTEFAGKIQVIKRKIIELLLSKCNAVTFVSEDLERNIDEQLKIRTKKSVIYPGVAIKQVNEDEVNKFRDKYDLKDAKPIISFIGPLVWKRKVEGVRQLIGSFRIVRKTYPTAKLLIIGDGPHKRELERIVKEFHMTEEVIFTGFLDNTFIPLSIIDIYTHISLQEGMPIALLEAMRMGKPVITTKAGGIPEVIEHGKNGLIVEPEPKEIAQTIISLYNDKERMRCLGVDAKKTVEERYRWEDIAQEFLVLYEINK
jgi:glycosyltransferase involved in cell wall biosynthesis